MNTDCLPPVGGYIIVNIDVDGIIRDRPRGSLAAVIHRETRNIHLGEIFSEYSAANRVEVHKTLFEAKEKLARHEFDYAILELTSEGGGKAIWCREEQKEDFLSRLARWKGCYGLWPVHAISS